MARNPADSGAKSTATERTDEPTAGASIHEGAVGEMLQIAPLPQVMRHEKPRVIVSRVLACLAHLALVAALIGVGWRHFDRPISGLAIATCYLLAAVHADRGRRQRPAGPGGADRGGGARLHAAGRRGGPDRPGGGLDAGVPRPDPALGGLLPGAGAVAVPGRVARGRRRHGPAVGDPCGVVLGQGNGGRSLAEAGLLGAVANAPTGGFWAGIDASYRLPVLIAYLASW